jgi:hypothetical protein
MMSTKTLYRLGALAGCLSGLFIFTGRMLASWPDTQPGEIVDWLSPFFALFFAMALYLRQRKASGILGGVAFIVMFSGMVMLVSMDFFGAFIRLQLPEALRDQIMSGPSAPVFIGALFTFLIGEILFGLSVIRARIFSRIAAALFMIGLLPVALHPSGIFSEDVVTLGASMVAAGLIWWGVQLFRAADAEKTASRTKLQGGFGQVGESLS